MRRGTIGPVHVVDAALLFICACGGDHPRLEFVEQAYRDRELRRNPVEPAPPVVADYALPDSVVRFGLDEPRAIGAVGPPRCEVAIADVGDRAMHVFSLDGIYGGTRYGTRLPRPFWSVSSIAMDTERLWIGYLSRPYFTMVSGVSDSVLQIARPTLVDAILPRVHLAAGPGGTLLEHWFVRGDHQVSDTWDPDLPLVRWFDSSGTVLSQGGNLVRYPGRTLTAALNWGFVGYARDTVWFARSADATVFAAPLDRISGSWVAAVRLPIAYRMRPPYESTTSIGPASHVQRHLTAFAVDPSGTVFVVAQALSWDARPTTALGVYHRPTGQYRAFDLGGVIYDVRVPTPRIVVVSHRDPTLHRAIARAYRLPTPDSDGKPGPAAEACRTDK